MLSYKETEALFFFVGSLDTMAVSAFESAMSKFMAEQAAAAKAAAEKAAAACEAFRKLLRCTAEIESKSEWPTAQILLQGKRPS